MRSRVTEFLSSQIERVEPFAEADGWKLLHLVDRRDDRNCADIPVDVFFPAADEFNGRAQRFRLRRQIAEKCEGCPVIDECLAGAVLRGERYGSWGGVAQPDFQELGRLWRRKHAAADEREVERVGCEASHHGTVSAYANYGCRCSDAREASRLHRAEQRARRKGAA